VGNDANNIIVEFAGLPGAGKSTITKAVANRLRSSGEVVVEPRVRNRIRKFKFTAMTIMKRPLISLSAIGMILATRQKSVRDYLATAYNFLYVSSLYCSAKQKAGIYIFDQGLIHALWSIGFSAYSPNVVGRLSPLVRDLMADAPTVMVVFVEVSTRTVARRIGNRPGSKSRLDALINKPNFDRALENAVATLIETRSTAEALSGEDPNSFALKIIDHDLDSSLDRNVTEIVDHIIALSGVSESAPSEK